MVAQQQQQQQQQQRFSNIAYYLRTQIREHARISHACN